MRSLRSYKTSSFGKAMEEAMADSSNERVINNLCDAFKRLTATGDKRGAKAILSVIAHSSNLTNKEISDKCSSWKIDDVSVGSVVKADNKEAIVEKTDANVVHVTFLKADEKATVMKTNISPNFSCSVYQVTEARKMGQRYFPGSIQNKIIDRHWKKMNPENAAFVASYLALDSVSTPYLESRQKPRNKNVKYQLHQCFWTTFNNLCAKMTDSDLVDLFLASCL